MSESSASDQLQSDALRRFSQLVDSVGVKNFSRSLDLSTRQVNRILAGAQPNPVERMIRCLQASEPDVGDAVLDFICQEMGGHFVRQEAVDAAAVNAVKECAEAIAAISDGSYTALDMKEVREAISALSGLMIALRNEKEAQSGNE